MTTTITRIYHFEAAHALSGWEGAAARVHGHSYTVEVTATRGVPTERIDKAWEPIRERCDYGLLNDEWPDTTVEGLAETFLELLPGALTVSVQEGDQRRGTATRP